MCPVWNSSPCGKRSSVLGSVCCLQAASFSCNLWIFSTCIFFDCCECCRRAHAITVRRQCQGGGGALIDLGTHRVRAIGSGYKHATDGIFVSIFLSFYLFLLAGSFARIKKAVADRQKEQIEKKTGATVEKSRYVRSDFRQNCSLGKPEREESALVKPIDELSKVRGFFPSSKVGGFSFLPITCESAL